MNPVDAASRELSDGEIVRVFNDRGSCLAGLRLTDVVRPGVVQMSVGAWYDPAPGDPSFCRHGNPNVLTADKPSSSLSQATTAQHALVEVERWSGNIPEVAVMRPPVLVPE
jgi:biotin/methionine sulfoxide reductase